MFYRVTKAQLPPPPSTGLEYYEVCDFMLGTKPADDGGMGIDVVEFIGLLADHEIKDLTFMVDGDTMWAWAGDIEYAREMILGQRRSALGPLPEPHLTAEEKEQLQNQAEAWENAQDPNCDPEDEE